MLSHDQLRLVAAAVCKSKRRRASVTVTPGKLRKFPYFKVQAHDPVTLAWIDQRKEAFDDEASARAYRKTVAKSIKTRIVKWDETGSHPLE
jgi:hypothetical protein